MIKVHVQCLYRFQTHWNGGFTKREFELRVQPLFDTVNARILREVQFIGAAGRTYEIEFPDTHTAIQWRKLVTEKYKLLHNKAPISINVATENRI